MKKQWRSGGRRIAIGRRVECSQPAEPLTRRVPRCPPVRTCSAVPALHMLCFCQWQQEQDVQAREGAPGGNGQPIEAVRIRQGDARKWQHAIGGRAGQRACKQNKRRRAVDTCAVAVAAQWDTPQLNHPLSCAWRFVFARVSHRSQPKGEELNEWLAVNSRNNTRMHHATGSSRSRWSRCCWFGQLTDTSALRCLPCFRSFSC